MPKADVVPGNQLSSSANLLSSDPIRIPVVGRWDGRIHLAYRQTSRKMLPSSIRPIQDAPIYHFRAARKRTTALSGVVPVSRGASSRPKRCVRAAALPSDCLERSSSSSFADQMNVLDRGNDATIWLRGVVSRTRLLKLKTMVCSVWVSPSTFGIVERMNGGSVASRSVALSR